MVIGICDDVQYWREQEIEYLKRLSEEIGQEFQYQTFETGEEVLAYNRDIDILLLDIELPGISGIETMRALEDYDNVKAILFVTGYDSYMENAFGMKTAGFLRKPLKYEQISKEIRIIINRWERKKRRIELMTIDGDVECIRDNILYVYGDRNYARLYAKEKEYVLCGNLRHWEEELEQYDIVRVHKSYLVNLENVSSIRQDVQLKNVDKRIPLGRKYRDTSRELYDKYRIKKIREEFLL